MSGTGLDGVKVLVTGARGGIGSEVVRELLESGAEVVALDRRGSVERAEGNVATTVVCEATREPVMLADAVKDAQAVVHLAAIPSPRGSERIVFENNVLATYYVLQAAAEAGVKCVIIASSISVLGLVYAPYHMSPLYVPIDEDHVLRPADPYALSKQCDEEIAATLSRTHGIVVYAFRFPFTTTAERIEARSAENSRDLRDGEEELWAYLDVRDAATAVGLGVKAGLRASGPAFEIFNIVADDSLIDDSLSSAIGRFHPDAEMRADLAPRSCAYTTTKAKTMLDFSARHLRTTKTSVNSCSDV